MRPDISGSRPHASTGGRLRGRRRDSDEPNELGVFSMFATTVPERGEGERPATVWGMVWRTGLLFAWYVGMYVANIWYYLTGLDFLPCLKAGDSYSVRP